jgi:hypothetical protein
MPIKVKNARLTETDIGICWLNNFTNEGIAMNIPAIQDSVIIRLRFDFFINPLFVHV